MEYKKTYGKERPHVLKTRDVTESEEYGEQDLLYTVSLGVDAEYVVLYACKWDEDEDGAEKPLFIWEPKDGTDSLNSELKNHLEDSNLANALLGNALAVMHSRFF